MKDAVVFGGYGTFGSLVARELARRGVAVLIAGRDAARAEAFARTLGPAHRGTSADVADRASCRAALAEHGVAVNCAGPFRNLGPALLDACLDEGCHYVDIADDRGYVRTVREHGDRFRERGLAAIFGCSSLPGLSGALALTARADVEPAPWKARVTLFIGNDNPKGTAAIRSLVEGLGKPIAAPQGTLRGFRDREVVPLPAPFGSRGVFNFDSPEYELFPDLLGADAVSVKVGFELRAVTCGLAALARLSSSWGPRTASLLEWAGGWFRGVGGSGGAVMAELFWKDGTVRRAALCARHDGQRMAALPCALAAHALLTGASASGAAPVYELLGAAPLLRDVSAEGFDWHKPAS